MTQTQESGYKTTLALPMAAADTTMEVATAPTVTKGRLLIRSGNTKERVQFTGVSSTTLTGLTRGLSQTADPATAGTGLTWVAGTEVILVSMHDQLLDKLEGDQAILEAKVYATTAARDTALGADAAATKAFTCVYVTATGLHYNYNLSSNQRESVDTGTTTPNASETVAGKVEEATTAEVTAGTNTGGTGAQTFVAPSKMQASIQSGEALYLGASAVGTDAYAVTGTPTVTAYTKGMVVSFETDVVNTGACTLDIDSLGVKNIKTLDGSDPENSDIKASQMLTLQYDGTNFVIKDQTKSLISSEISKFGGDGSDGAQGDAALTITGSNNTYITKNFTSWAAGSVSRTCTVTPTNCIVHIKVSGNADFTNRTFDFDGKGGPGGAGGDGSPDMGSDGTDGLGTTAKTGKGKGGDGVLSNEMNRGAIGGESYLGLTALSQHPKAFVAACGSGGGGGAHSDGESNDGGAGGAGGGCLIMEVKGDITWSSSVITADGDAGTVGERSGPAPSGGGGGGGGGGAVVVLYSGTETGSVTPTVSGGSGGGVTTGGSGGAGSGGGGGSSVQGNGANTTNATPATPTSGGAGKAGLYLIEANEVFAE